jgi:hypothetical protein
VPSWRRAQNRSDWCAFQNAKQRETIGARTNDALRRFDESLHFLAGVLTVLPLLNVQSPILKSDTEKLFVDLQRMRHSIKPKRTTAFIRLLRKHEEKIDRLVSKIEKSGNTEK